jgi:hypothetical protein
MNQLVFVRSNPPLSVEVSRLVAGYGSAVVGAVRHFHASSGDAKVRAPGFIFSLHHVGDRTHCIGTLVGREVRGTLSTEGGTEHELTVLVDAAQTAG